MVVGEVACDAGAAGAWWGKDDAVAAVHVGAGAGAGAGAVGVVQLWGGVWRGGRIVGTRLGHAGGRV